MHILLITHFLPPTHTEGTENYTLGLAQTFIARGHKAQVLCAENWQTGKTYWNGVTQDAYKNIPVHRVNLNWTKASNPNQVLYDSPIVEQWFDQFLSRIKPDVVHVTSTYSLGIGILRSVHRAGIPLALTLMDFWFLCPRTVLLRGNGRLCNGQTTPWQCQQCLLESSKLFRATQLLTPASLQPTLWNRISHTPVFARMRGVRGMVLDVADRQTKMKQALELPDVILSHSQFVQRMFAQANLSQRVTHLPNGHEMSWASNYRGKRQSSVLRIGYMGQIGETKGVHILIEAFRKIDSNGDARLDIWGDISKHKTYIQQLQALAGNSKLIALRGRFKRAQLADVLAEIDVLVVPSLWYENAPLVIYEAFAAKTPVIATDLGGMAEAVTHEVNGLLFERGNADDLAEQLQRIVDQPGFIDRLRAGIAPVKTIDEEITELELIYKTLR